MSVVVLERKAAAGLKRLGSAPGQVQEPGKVLLFQPGKQKIELEDIGIGKSIAARAPLSFDKTPFPYDHTIASLEVLNKLIGNLPPYCKSFGTPPDAPGSCRPELNNEDSQYDQDDQDWWANEVLGGVDTSSRRRHPLLLSRAQTRTVKFTCGTNPSVKIYLPEYPVPKTVKADGEAGTPIPVMQPLIRCKDTDCPVSNWDIEEYVDETKADQKLESTDWFWTSSYFWYHYIAYLLLMINS